MIGAIEAGQEKLFMNRVAHKLAQDFDHGKFFCFLKYNQDNGWDLPDVLAELLDNAQATKQKANLMLHADDHSLVQLAGVDFMTLGSGDY